MNVRADDPENPASALVKMVMRWRGWGALIWAIMASGGTVLAMRFFLVDRLDAQESFSKANREMIVSDSVEMDRRMQKIESNQLVELKSICLDRTLYEQRLIGLDCPPELRKDK